MRLLFAERIRRSAVHRRIWWTTGLTLLFGVCGAVLTFIAGALFWPDLRSVLTIAALNAIPFLVVGFVYTRLLFGGLAPSAVDRAVLRVMWQVALLVPMTVVVLLADLGGPTTAIMLVAAPVVSFLSVRRAVRQDEADRLSRGICQPQSPGDAARVARICQSLLATTEDAGQTTFLLINRLNGLIEATKGFGGDEGEVERADLLAAILARDLTPEQEIYVRSLRATIAGGTELTEGDLRGMATAVEELVAAAARLERSLAGRNRKLEDEVPGIAGELLARRLDLAQARLSLAISSFVPGISSRDALVAEAGALYRQALEAPATFGGANRAHRLTHLVGAGLSLRQCGVELPVSADDVRGLVREAQLAPRYARPAMFLVIGAMLPQVPGFSGEDARAVERGMIRARRQTRDPLIRLLLDSTLVGVKVAALRLTSPDPDAYAGPLADLRRLVEVAALREPGRVPEIAMDLGDLAHDLGLVNEAVWAYQEALRATRGLLASSSTRFHREALVRAVRQAAPRAAQGLIAGDRLREAVTVLETGQAMIATEVVEREILEARLHEAGHGDLSRRCHELTLELRRAEIRRDGGWTLRSAGRRERAALNRLRADWTALLTEIHTLPGFGRALADPTYDDIRARCGGHPVVYLTAGDDQGFALILDQGGLTKVPLPGVTTGEMREIGDLFRSGGGLDDCLTWLSRRIAEPLTAALRGRSRVTLIPTGELAGLPVHAARPLMDHITVSYLPSIRMTGPQPPERTGGVMVAVHPGPPGAHLRYVRREAEFLKARYDAKEVTGDVIAAMREASVYHFACHGAVNRQDPLGSALSLRDGDLTIRDLLVERVSRGGIAVLSACESGISAFQLASEAVSLPTTLLQAGAVGAVGTLWPVHDLATFVLITRFYDEWLGRGRTPQDALRHAQLWLRDASSADFRRQRREAMFRGGEAEENPPWGDPRYWAAFVYVGAVYVGA